MAAGVPTPSYDISPTTRMERGPSQDTDFTFGAARVLMYQGTTAADVAIRDMHGQSMTIINMQPGQEIHHQFVQILTSGTTANILDCYIRW